MKIVINNCYGGFGLSDEACKELGISNEYSYVDEIKRNDKKLVAVVERLGSDRASGNGSELKVVNIPNGVEWEIIDYDGIETIHEKHRRWR